MYLAARQLEFGDIPAEHRASLAKIANFVKDQYQEKLPARLLFVCTHNSRRSHLAQIWTAAAASYYQLPIPLVYSGGTESTAFNPRAVAVLERTGMKIQKTTGDENPIYHVRFSDDGSVITAFSKVINQAPNPKKDFCAVMVCDSADKSCPSVSGAIARVALPYVDPKQSDDTPDESRTYDERSRQIAREMLYVMSLVRAAN
ncbi:MAG: protein-tyrosine-phosphatase [Planctomycetes bacterium]|nr:protein-tyrosine-phosphatase [Planctomycetota bacterium]